MIKSHSIGKEHLRRVGCGYSSGLSAGLAVSPISSLLLGCDAFFMGLELLCAAFVLFHDECSSNVTSLEIAKADCCCLLFPLRVEVDRPSRSAACSLLKTFGTGLPALSPPA